MRLTPDDLVRVNERLRGASPEAILRFAHDTFGDRTALLSSMQRAGLLLAHLANRAGLPFDVVFVDTGVLHPETLAARDALTSSHRHLHVRTLTPTRSFRQQTDEEGLLYLSKEGQERCCDLRKSAPLRAEKGRYDALVSALRRGEGGTRSRISAVSLDVELGALRVHPFVDTTDEELAAYAGAHPDAVENALHGMGFPTIGCYTCTTPVRPDEDERAGRWRHLEAVTYCGINPSDGDGPGVAGGMDFPDEYAAALGVLGPLPFTRAGARGSPPGRRGCLKSSSGPASALGRARLHALRG